MATPRAAEHRDIEQRFKKMQAQLDRLSSQVLRQRQLSVSQGDFEVSGGGGIVVQAPGDLTIVDASGNTVFSALNGPLKVAVANAAQDTQNFATAGTWKDMVTATIAVPTGFTRALVFAMASSGASTSASGPGAWKVRPVIAGTPDPSDGTAGSLQASQAASWACGFSRSLTGLSGSFDVVCQANAGAGSSFVGSSANGHITAIALFLR